MSRPHWTRLILATALALVGCGDEATGPAEEEPGGEEEPGPPPETSCTAAIEIIDPPTTLRQGDVAGFEALVTGTGCDTLGAQVTWSLVSTPGLIDEAGLFVGYQPGEARVRAQSGALADTATVTITPRGLSGAFTVIGRGLMTTRYTSDLWLVGDYAYTGTWGGRSDGGETRWGDRMYAWSITDPANPVLTDSVVVNARTVNDVKVRADGALAVITHESSPDGLNGITLLDLNDPAHPSVIRRFTDQANLGGVHNVWIDGSFVYAASGSMVVIDISNPASPSVAGSFYGGSSLVHDIYVRDGLAFVSHWDAGLVILDVGNGVRGGSPQQPVEVSRISLDGQTHNAWYWPEGGYVFVGREAVYPGPYGLMHVVDVADLASPRRVATYRVDGSEPHNFWLDEERGILYAAWYTEGVRAVDVSGQLIGELDRQGREIAFLQYNGAGSCFAADGTCTWAPQLHQGLVWVSDMNQGLVGVRPVF